MVKVDRRIRWHYTTTILRLRIVARLSRYRNCKFHNFARTISRHADGIIRYSVSPSAGPLLPLTVSCFSKIQIGFTFLVPAHLGSPGKGPLNGCVCVCVCVRACARASFCVGVVYDSCAQRHAREYEQILNLCLVWVRSVLCVFKALLFCRLILHVLGKHLVRILCLSVLL